MNKVAGYKVTTSYILILFLAVAWNHAWRVIMGASTSFMAALVEVGAFVATAALGLLITFLVTRKQDRDKEG